MASAEATLEVGMSSNAEFRRREVRLEDALVARALLKVELVVGELLLTGGGRVGRRVVRCRVKVVLGRHLSGVVG